MKKVITILHHFAPICIVLLAALALAGCSLLGSAEVTKADVVFLGDSITSGYYLPDPHDPWACKLLERFGPVSISGNAYIGKMIFENAGIGGNTTSQMLDRLRHDVLSFDPKRVFVLAGVNDIAGGSSVADVEGHLTRIYDDCEASGAAVIACTLTPWPGGTPQEQAEIVQINAWIRVGTLPVVDFYSANPEISPIDKIHPTANGNTTMADTVNLALIQ
jgi:hypothetical protein